MALTPFISRLIADTGISMGDEGKGRLISELVRELQQRTRQPDPVAVVMKVNGGANSGHTVRGLKLNLLPAGVVEASVDTLAIGAGVVADPRKFEWEALPLEQKGYQVRSRLAIDERTLVSDVSHRLLDLAWEHYRTHVLREEARGSTGRGITPAYTDEVGQWQIYYADFKGDKDAFAHKILQRTDRACRTIQYVCQVTPEGWDGFFATLTEAEQSANTPAIEAGVFTAADFDFNCFKGAEPFTVDVATLIDIYWETGKRLLDCIHDVREVVLTALREERYLIGEFGQSFWLDKRHGFPPNVTASHTFTPELFQSAGIPLQPAHTIGCCKAYDTKVGTHLFLTEMPSGHPLTVRLKKLEFGVSTGRQRKVGWFDAVEKGDALRYGGFQDLVINKLDALSGAESLKIGTAYESPEGKRYTHVPRQEGLRARLRPVYHTLPGWHENITAVRRFVDLPTNAQQYVAFAVKSLIDIALRDGTVTVSPPNVRYIGVGPGPSQVIKDIPKTQELVKLYPTTT